MLMLSRVKKNEQMSHMQNHVSAKIYVKNQSHTFIYLTLCALNIKKKKSKNQKQVV